jgi:glycosyltransferase involved in cell wall biosynthesis
VLISVKKAHIFHSKKTLFFSDILILKYIFQDSENRYKIINQNPSENAKTERNSEGSDRDFAKNKTTYFIIFVVKEFNLARIIITTSNNLVFDNRIHKVTVTLTGMGYDVLQTGRNHPKVNTKPSRPGTCILFNLPFRKGFLFYLTLNLYTLIYLIFKKFDMLWAVDMDTLPACRIAGMIRRKPIIFDSHEFMSEVPELHNRPIVKKTWRLLEKTFIPGCNIRYTVSPGLIDLYKTRYGIHFKLLRNLPLENDKRKTRVFVPDKSIPPTIHYQGSLNIGRGIEETIKAMQYLPGYKFVVVGKGDCDDELKKLVADLKLEKQVTFTGSVPFEELPNYHQNVMAGMCLLENKGLNYYHALPNRIFDYMQAGIPVITSNLPDIAGVVQKHQTGLLLSNLNPKDIASAIRHACENSAQRRLWQKSIPQATRKFTWENEAKALEVIKSLLQ